MPCFGKVNAPLGRGARGLKTAAAVRSQKTAKGWVCQQWDSNPRLQGRLRPERSALDRSAILKDPAPTEAHPLELHLQARGRELVFRSSAR
ncbi:hypothetical protein ROHU_017863 [Labeo rohita]|uniref:Uncharacterized protein n=1 Tax=Labeo rohita TaxID=84645 RepID=A0A498ND36_LABRO|nr:hypothetical protein ROHU_017863 [Labeo rohita]